MNESTPEEPSKPIQRESWEIEILISGGAFFSLYQLSGFLQILSEKLSENPSVFIFLGFIVGGLRMLSIYFAIHLCVRAFWLSLVLLQKVYPKGIDVEKLRLAEPYKSYVARFQLNQRLADLDSLSGLIFAWAVTFVITFVGLGLAFCAFMIPAFLIVQAYPDLGRSIIWRTFVRAVGLSLLIFIIDTLFFGVLRRKRILGKIYRPVYLFWNALSIGFLWRPGFQMIYSNSKSKWRVFLLALLSIVLVSFMSGDEKEFIKMFDERTNATAEIIVDETRYLDKREAGQWGGSFIHSDVITDNYVKVFVYFNSVDDKQVDSLKSTDGKYFSRLIKLTINDSACHDPEWVGVDRANGQKGILTVLDVSHLKKKMHLLKIDRVNKKGPVVIPFWKQ